MGKETITIEITVIDLQHDECGWMANGCSVDRYTLTVPKDIKDQTLVRRIKAKSGIQGWRRDEWSGSEWSWRKGSMGAYADIVL